MYTLAKIWSQGLEIGKFFDKSGEKHWLMTLGTSDYFTVILAKAGIQEALKDIKWRLAKRGINGFSVRHPRACPEDLRHPGDVTRCQKVQGVRERYDGERRKTASKTWKSFSLL
ncbi:MAG: hypothetical protein BGO77_03255 [Caedibacter sp. 37-49]|nr:MAG: hypothetical protein BGO77_03255 [Caedibacter sp. 37-49]